jgi:hypothetical protein
MLAVYRICSKTLRLMIDLMVCFPALAGAVTGLNRKAGRREDFLVWVVAARRLERFEFISE